ncbi:hypothetical protein QIG_1020 [Clostridioides difficile DA00065]|nr:hypothetical protein QIG_1020 [Clostridioides difficile DA00065]
MNIGYNIKYNVFKCTCFYGKIKTYINVVKIGTFKNLVQF